MGPRERAGRTLNLESTVGSLDVKDSPHPSREGWERPPGLPLPDLPTPTGRYRRRAWLAFQRALDPLARPKPLPLRELLRRRERG